MEENLVCWGRTQQTMMEETDALFNLNSKIETLKAIPHGYGVCLRRLFKKNKLG